MSQATERAAVTPLGAVTVAWLITSIYYFYQYAMRSAPAVMVPEMSAAFGLTPVGIASLIGLFYYAYAPFSLVAGVAMDQLGPRKVVPLGAATVAVGALLFATGDPNLASIGRFMQGAGGVFALIGAVFIATTHFPASKAATLIGATQMFGMAGGSAGQFVVGPAIAGGLVWSQFWWLMGIAGIPIAILLFLFIPKRQAPAQPVGARHNWMKDAGSAMWTVFRNPQSIICGLISGLLFIPTTIFDMVWGVRFLQEGHGMPYDVAVLRSAAVPFGWIIGCPLLGWISDKIGRRKPVIIVAAAVLMAAMAMGLYGPPGLLPPYTIALVAGIASGAAMIPYTIIKEANRPEHSGTATGVINFINFSFSALLGPIFAERLMRISGGSERGLGDYQATFMPMLFGIGIAILLALLLRETGTARRAQPISSEPLTEAP
jgi:MFS family permease